MTARRTTAAPPRTAPVPGADLLRDGLVEAARLLKLRQASAIPVEVIDGCVDRNWLEWRGGGLFLTITGENVCRQARTPSAS